MNRSICYTLLPALVLAFFGWKTSQAESPSTPSQQPQADPNKTESDSPKYLRDMFISETSLSYNGYEIVKLTKKVKYRYPREMRIEAKLIDVNYTAIKRQGKVIATFDGVHYSLGNLNDLGLFSFLGGETKQLFISQTVPRGGRHWIIDLSSDFRVLLDSYEYQVGREEVWLNDIDNDGVCEVFLEDPSFYMAFPGLSMAGTPIPETIFKYDDRAKKYLPANHIFHGFALRGIDEEIKKISSEQNKEAYVSDRLGILLRYIYAGKEREGWVFFDREYNFADRGKVKSQVKAVLKEHPVHKYIYSKGAT